MIKKYLVVGALTVALGGAMLPSNVLAQEAAKASAVRPEVGKPVQAALDLLKAKKSKDALAKLRDAEAVKDRTPYEVYLVERVKAQAYVTMGDAPAAARAFEAAAALPGAPAGEKSSLLTAAAGQYYTAKDYSKAAALASRYIHDGGNDSAMRTIYVQSLYLSGDFANTAKTLSADIHAQEQAQKRPSEEELQMLAQAYLKQNDNNGYGKTLEKLVAYYPKKEYWESVIYSAKQRGGLGDRLALDLARLQRATGTLHTASEYEDAVALALQQGYPAEAKKVFDEGMGAKIMGQGKDADRHRRLGDMTNKSLADDTKALESADAAAQAAKDGNAQVNLGFNYVLHGQNEKGLQMMEAGIKKDAIKHPEDAKLHLGYAYYLAGKRAKAVQVLKSVSGTDGAATLASLWVIYIQHSS